MDKIFRFLNPHEVILRHIRQEVGGDESASAVEFADEESVVVHFAENDENVAGAEGELHLAVDVGRELRRVVVVQRKLASGIDGNW